MSRFWRSQLLRARADVPILLRQLMRRVDQHYDAELARAGLRTTQYALLNHVAKLGPLGPGELALAMKMQPSTVTRSLQAVLRECWVDVGPGVDGRSRTVSITELGRSKRRQARQYWLAAQQSVESAIGGERLLQLHQAIAAAMSGLDAVPVPPRQESTRA